MSEKKQPDVDPEVLGDVFEDPADVEEDDSIVLPSEADAPDLYKPPAP